MTDHTITSTHRAALRRLSRGEPLGDLEPTFGALLAAGLVDVHPDSGATVSDLGWRYLDASALAPTRRLPRPAPPTVPDGWRYSGDRLWSYTSDTTAFDVDVADATVRDLLVLLEEAEAAVSLLRYIRAVGLHAERDARDGARAVDAGDAASAPTPPTVGDGLAGDGWELLCDCDPCPHRGAP